MCDALVWSFDAIIGLPWLELIKALAPAVTAFIAWRALQNWRRQDKAKREAEFLDQLVDATHAYIAEMSKPITVVEFVNIGTAAHAPTWEGGDQSIKGAIAYIEKRGQEHSKHLFESLNGARAAVIRLRSLVTKGQVFKFDDYAKCHAAVSKLTSQFDVVEWLASVIGSTHWNWENHAVLDVAKGVLNVKADEVRKRFDECSTAVIQFVSDRYSHIYR